MKRTKFPLISIITVSYNAVSSIEETILSVINQDFADYEYIIIDGGSTDGTVDIIKKYQDKITLWISEPDKGIYDAMNKGINVAKGEWCYFMNAGDYFYDLKLLANVNEKLKETEYSVVVGKVALYDKSSNVSKYFPEFKNDIIDYKPRYLFNSHLCHQALLVRTLTYRSVGCFNLDYKFFSDFNTVYTIIANEKRFEKIDLVIAKYNLDGVSANYKSAIKLFLESEIILKKCGDTSSRCLYYLRFMHIVLYYLKCFFLNKIK
ncbi:glycosyltransferase family 2 protein [Flavobacterium limnophilum]|uniref:glycosyltransferase family 2 protein n=1 Tax=Flavobacterium limnophilum TaxID=3003262 RepID=UPI0022AC589F|nr:glycosyltransferase family 2 protein [Flavobacterium limnophilum]